MYFHLRVVRNFDAVQLLVIGADLGIDFSGVSIVCFSTTILNLDVAPSFKYGMG